MLSTQNTCRAIAFSPVSIDALLLGARASPNQQLTTRRHRPRGWRQRRDGKGRKNRGSAEAFQRCTASLPIVRQCHFAMGFEPPSAPGECRDSHWVSLCGANPESEFVGMKEALRNHFVSRSTRYRICRAHSIESDIGTAYESICDDSRYPRWNR